ncbi:MAG TPA: YMGG-like glycine zipper-containing protein [Flavipsychrobacter sp.]|nr:YMGG-like glycine zipper-containing protein [Flavipsychrobacter sp.]
MKRIVLLVAIAAGVVTASCNSRANREMEARLQAQQQTIEDMKLAMDRQHLIDSMSQVVAMQKEAEAAKAKQVTTVYRAPRRSSANRANSYAATRNVDNSYQQQQQQPQVVYQPAEQQQPQKKGWSAKAKGAVIGAGVGALGGALIGKRKGTGALIGAGVGALAGLGTGAIIDKKNGR